MGLFGPPNIEKLIARKNVFGLIKALINKNDPKLRLAAAEALGEIGDARAVQPLMIALRHQYFRSTAIKALVKIGGPAVESLIAALNDTDGDMRWAAAEALGKIGDPRAVEPLIANLSDTYLYARRYAAEALGKISDTRALEPLIAAMSDEDVIMRRFAAEALNRIGDARAAKSLTAALSDEDSDVRRFAAEALEKIGDANIE